MKRWEKMHDVTDREFLRQVGVPRAKFETILEKVQDYLDAERARNRMKNRGVKTTRLPVEDRLLLTFYYLLMKLYRRKVNPNYIVKHLIFQSVYFQM